MQKAKTVSIKLGRMTVSKLGSKRYHATKQTINNMVDLLRPGRRSIFMVDTQEDFERKVKKSDKPVVVDFFASWCKPCKALTPRLENIIKEKAGELRLAKVDIDENSELALDYDVASVPSILLMCNGQVVNRMVGLQDTNVVRDWIDAAVKQSKETDVTENFNLTNLDAVDKNVLNKN